MSLTTKNYLQKKIINFLFNEKVYNNLRVYKTIITFMLKLPSDSIFKFSKYLIKDGDFVIDIGANIGQSAVYFSKYVGVNGKVLSIEPVKKNYKSLIFMKKIMKMRNVITLNSAISDTEGKENILIPVMDKNMVIGTQAVLESSKKTNFNKYLIEIVEKTTIDDLAGVYNFSKLNLIKCDTEGAEIDVVKGGIKTIKKHKPTIVLEISLNNPQLYLLYELGYKPYHFKNQKLILATNSGLKQDPIFIHNSKINEINLNN